TSAPREQHTCATHQPDDGPAPPQESEDRGMYHPTIFFEPVFVVSVIAGFLVTVLGALLLLVAAVWFVAAGEWQNTAASPAAGRALCALGLAAFLGGWLWQLVGYWHVGAVTFGAVTG